MAYAFNKETLYEKTDNGLDIFKKFLGNCPNFEKALDNPKKNPFQYRGNDDSFSAYLVEPEQSLKGNVAPGFWRMKDHGGDFFNPISLAMQETGFDYFQCLKHLYEVFGLVEGKSYFSSVTEFKPLEENDERTAGWFNIVFKEKYFDLKIIGKYVTPKLAKKYHLQSVYYYEKVFMNGKTNVLTYLKSTSTDNYPIFSYSPDGEKGNFHKLYEPFAIKNKQGKSTKHGYLGTKPERFVHGFQQILDEVDTSEIDSLITQIETAKKDGYLKNKDFIEKLEADKNELMLETIFICSGGSDGLNIASLDNSCIWFNSESEKINHSEYAILKKYCKYIYNLPDVDAPGLKYAYEVAETFWELKTIYLPKEKLGTNGKDFRDWMKFYNNSDLESVKFQFNNLLNGALKLKFFERNSKSKVLKIKPTYLHYFLKVQGFYLYYPEKQFTDKVAEQEYIFIKIDENIVTQYFPNQIRKFCERYLINKGQSVDVIDKIKICVDFTDKNLLGLDDIILDFRNYTINSQTFFFKNLLATVTAEKIELKPYKNYDRFVWQDSKLDKNISLENPYFKHSIDKDGKDKVEILRSDCDYMNFLINGSRIFWRKELETPFAINQKEEKLKYHNENRFSLNGAILNEEEKQLQQQHFLNKCWSIGFIMHRQKTDSLAKWLCVMDDKEKMSDDDANGRSGKSVMFKGVDYLLKNRFVVDGKNKNLTQDKHLLHGFTKENDYLLIEDLDRHVPITHFFNWITGSIPVNPKNTKPYEVKFPDSGKGVIITNYGISHITDSIIGRLIFVAMSDYYHVKNDTFLEERKVKDDFGYDLFSEAWKEKEWNIYYNFLLFCNQFFLKNRDREIKAPQNNIDINNAKASMGDVFIEWCESYFTDSITDHNPELQETTIIPGTLNEYIPRKVMQENYNQFAVKYSKTANNFKTSLKKYCKMQAWVFNPVDLLGSDGTIKKPVTDHKGKRDIVEHFFIKTIKEETPPVASELKEEKIIEEIEIQKPDLDF